jgi:PAS domain S-box-containing protein
LETIAWNKQDNDAVRGTIAITRDVTQQKLAEQEIQNALSLLKAIFNSTAEGIMAVDSLRRIVSYNDKFAQSWGIPEEVLASGDHKRAVSIAMRHVKDPLAFREQVERIYATPDESGELTAELLDGRFMECYSQPQLIDGKVVGRVWSNRDITERKRSEQQLLKVAKLDHLLSEVSRTFIEEDMDSAIHFTLELLGEFGDIDRDYVFRYHADEQELVCTHQWQAEGIKPQTDLMLGNDGLKSAYYWFHQQIRNGHIVNLSSLDDLPPEAVACKELFQKDHTQSVLIMPMMLNNQTIGFIGYDSVRQPKRWSQEDIQVLQVITEILTNALAKSDAEKQLKEAKDVAEQANRSKSEFLANLSHEIRTPLNVILGFAELLSKDETNERQKHYLQAIQSSGNNLLSLINDILDLSKIEAGKLEIQYVPVRLRSVLREIERVFSISTLEKQLKFCIDVDPAVPDGLLLDEVRLRQILFNLVGNAVKFTEQGYVKISARVEEIRTEPEEINLIIEIEDTGIGIKANQLEIIFEAFQQQSGQSTRRFGGTGLGLAITRRLVEMMQGKISVRSKVGKGSVFQVCLHHIALAPAAESPDERLPELELMTRFELARVLVADDVDFNRELIKGYLKESGLVVLEAENGLLAYEAVWLHRPEVVLMDIKMPVLDGYGAVRKIKAEAALAKTKVIALTAQILEPDKRLMIDAGFDDYLAKPVSRSQLLSKLKSFIPHTPISQRTDIEIAPEEGELSAEIKEKIPFLIRELRHELLPIWEESRRKFIITQIEAFARQVKAKGESYHVAPLTHYGTTLLAYSSNFDMERLPQSLAEFPAVIEKIENM